MSRRVIDVPAMTTGHRSLGHHVVPTNANLSAVLLCHTVNISARYNHCTIALPISAIIITDVSARTGYHRSLGHLVAPTDVNLSEFLLCHTDNISAQSYRHLGEDRLPLVIMASPSSLDYCIRPSSLDYGIGLLS